MKKLYMYSNLVELQGSVYYQDATRILDLVHNVII